MLVDLVPWPADPPDEDAVPSARSTDPAPSEPAPRVRPEPPKARPKPKPMAKPRAKPKASPKPAARPKPAREPLTPQPDTKVVPAPTKPKIAADPKPEPKPKNDAAPKPEPGAKPKNDTASKPEPRAKPKVAPKPEAKSIPDPEPQPGEKPGEKRPGEADGGEKAEPDEPKPSAGAQPASPSPDDGAGDEGRKKARRGYRPLARAFSRELPFAVSRDPIWEKLPLGEVGSVTVVVRIGDDGRIRKLAANDDAPESLAGAVKRTRPALGGRFRLSEGEVAGEEVLRIDVRLEQRDPPPKQRIHYDVSQRPTRDRPGVVFFITESGRCFEATVTILSSTPG